MSGTENQVCLLECGRTDPSAYRARDEVVKKEMKRFRIKWQK